MTPTLALAADLDVGGLSDVYTAVGRVQVPGVLTSPAATALAEALETFDDWRLSVAASEEFFEIPLRARRAADPSRQSWIDPVRIDGVSRRMQYLFDTRRLLENTPSVGDVVDEALAFLNSPAFIAFARGVTGDARIDFADAQATRYRPGHVLTTHDDRSPGKNRLHAYVLNLTRNWSPDWGGALIFPSTTGAAINGFTPTFNALNLFRVPQLHAVTQVTDFARNDRLAITGWLRTRQDLPE